ncbi:MAG: c-type cytochrome [Flavobacteriaceae bacterium]
MKTLSLLSVVVYLAITGFLYQNKPLEESIREGAILYQDFCLQCHMANGEGVPGTFPPLAQSDYLRNELEKSIQGVKYGMRGPLVVNGTTYNGIMVAQGLDDEEVADIMNYVLQSWGNAGDIQVTETQVAAIKRPSY